MHTEQVLGDTGCLFFRGGCIPFYRISSREWILMDSGQRFMREELDMYLKENGIRVRAVLCSHAHYDHTENNRYLQETHNARIVLSAMDAGILADPTSLKACFYSYTRKDNEHYNREMLCLADQVFVPWEPQVQVEGVSFQILSLPGHAASHVGYVTPDGVAYLADSVSSPDPSGKERLAYMLDWTRSFQTMEAVQAYDYRNYILAHCGIYEEIREVAQENLSRYGRLLDGFYHLFTTGLTAGEVLEKAAGRYHFSTENYEKACLFERIIRSMTEYLVEQGRIRQRVREGVLVYEPEDSKTDV